LLVFWRMLTSAAMWNGPLNSSCVSPDNVCGAR
jgi:hypothetical protein